mmetsp:Transcript_97113/g.274510  ORF Transcript_97113/g.274510 Transcript_97113/m.274510 type:complete len:127 (-) Transcript_97113:560-940(-)
MEYEEETPKAPLAAASQTSPALSSKAVPCCGPAASSQGPISTYFVSSCVVAAAATAGSYTLSRQLPMGRGRCSAGLGNSWPFAYLLGASAFFFAHTLAMTHLLERVNSKKASPFLEKFAMGFGTLG